MIRPRILDLFCGAGGAAMGYHRAGFDVFGVDAREQPRYPFWFQRADALTFPLDGFDAIHASPPCQAYSALRPMAALNAEKEYPDLVALVRERLRTAGVPYVIENVEGSPLLPGSILLCGSMFGLDVRRHRLFESNVGMLGLECRHDVQTPRFRPGLGRNRYKSSATGLASTVGVYGSCHFKGDLDLRKRAMGIEWMRNRELCQAIPPAYTEHVGRFLLGAVLARRAEDRAGTGDVGGAAATGLEQGARSRAAVA